MTDTNARTTPFEPLIWETIEKSPSERARSAMTDYDFTCSGFDWEAARSALSGLPGGAVNIAHEAVDRHLDTSTAHTTALRWLSATGDGIELTYADLAALSNRFAGVLRSLGVRRGERICLLLGRTPQLYVAALGAWKAGCVVSPLFSAFGPEPVRQRLEISGATTLVTTTEFYRRKVAPHRDAVPELRNVLVTDDLGPERGGGLIDLSQAMASMSETFPVEHTDADEPALLHFTSGTTGRPKGAVHVHGAVLAHRVSARYALDLRAGDRFWCTADPGWVTGMSYGVIAPLCLGATVISDEAEFSAQRWYDILTAERVSVWYTSPTALRMLMRGDDRLPPHTDLSNLRFVAGVGEPLNPEIVVWGERVLGRPVHDNWWQTETGAIMIANFAAEQVRPGSMGRPLPGIEATVLRRGANGKVAVDGDGAVRPADTDEVGELAIRAGWPSMFRDYWNDHERYERAFAHGWYLSGDLARRDADGYYWFVGRADDVIESAGHLIGPFEVESALMAHPAVAEAGAIGTPDPVAGEVVKAFVTLLPGYRPTEELRTELLAFGRRSLGSVAPRQITFADSLPHTRSGKVMRRLLKARELGLPEGDVSALEGGAS
ncbi:acetate--CoA ligase [Nocardia bovistercoris]|uniref:acetate--CoA ligase n=1 Tax=Nocardia bovistercoris TaxID=2785916 RepID=A0A931IHY1_9NOCA|nr:acetate--CoA ligase [Nocardia bovistercoris]MBH0781751.1 acetate--CoA ligase [Nocardia bovistercoris]